MKYFTIKNSLFLVSSSKQDEEYRKIDVFLNFLEKSGVGNLINSIYLKEKINKIGRNSYNPFNMFAMICYCFSRYESTLREIENLCIFDLRVIYIMEQQTPSYKVICEFINKYIVPYQFEIFTMITETIINEYGIDISNQYLDGTKIEANANKYKFVWKPTTFHKKLDLKIKQHLSQISVENLTDEKQLIKTSELNNILNTFAIQSNEFDINIFYNIIKPMNKYIAIHKIINISIFMLFPIAGYIILAHNQIKNGFYGIILIILNLIEIGIFIAFIIVSSRCEWGTRKQHAVLKGAIAFFIYLIIAVFTIIYLI